MIDRGIPKLKRAEILEDLPPILDKTVAPEALALLHRVRKHTDIPLALGFGISTPEHLTICKKAGADGVIVGSAIVDLVEKHLDDRDSMERALGQYVSQMKKAAEKSNI